MSRTLAAMVIAIVLAGPALADEDPAHVEVTTTRVLQSDTLSALDRAQTLVTRGLAREKLYRPKDAYDDFTYALSLHALPSADIARVRFDRGVVLEEMNKPEDAIADYTAAINFEPRFAAAYNNRANVYRRLGRLDDAMRDYNASLANGNPQPEYPLYGLGQIAEALGRTDVARSYYQQALANNPHFDLAAQRMGVMTMPSTEEAPTVLRPPHLTPPNPETEVAVAPAPPMPTPAAPPTERHRSAWLGPSPIQLGAFHDEASAMAEWNKIAASTGTLLDGHTPRILPLDQGDRRIYRLQTGPFPYPRDVCDKVVAAGFGCFPARDAQSKAAAATATAASP
ncbi:MAG TPA: tetratricopeptide repeat protein [Rhizomicrobium sp.]|nr:tetratricopeptide repeat protein [Rhizomicrobium sp.]